MIHHSFETFSWPTKKLMLLLSLIVLQVLMINAGKTDVPVYCPKNTFTCITGECLPKSKVCDGVKDCGDGADEFDCDYVMCREPMWFKCANDKCVSSFMVCDGENDCGDWSDEKKDCNITKAQEQQVTCTSKQWRCLDNSCIPKKWVCDGKQDCMDGSDEFLGCSDKIECDGFKCNNGHCIFNEWRCDGNIDCLDGSDEEGCDHLKTKSPRLKECTHARGYFLCKDGVTCLELKDVCDNKTSCLDGSDEGGLCNTPMCNSSKCSHNCHPTPIGPRCSCPKGYQLIAPANTTCIDEDECMKHGLCSQRCHNMPGSFYCSCDVGYNLLEDNKTCMAGGQEPVLVYSSLTEIRSYSLRTNHMASIQRKQKKVTGVSFNGRRVYWSSLEEGEERIMRSREDGSKKEVLVTSGLGMPEDMAWDWVTRKLYFTDGTEKHVAVCTADGHVCAILVNTVTDSPRGIVLAPQDGMMYWSDWGKKPHIAKAGMDGSDPQAFIKDNLYWPNSVALDYSNGRLYWVDAKFHTLESSRLDGTDRRLVLKMAVSSPFSVALFENTLYWSDMDGREIKSCNKFTGKQQKTLVRETKQSILGIHIYHPALQPSLPNSCKLASCSHLCLLAPGVGNFSCACPSSMRLTQDRRTCVELSKKSYILVGVGHKLLKVQHQTLGRQNISEIPLQTVARISAMTYNPISGSIIISDEVDKKIISLDLKEMRVTTLISSQLGKVSDMDFDPLGNNIYFTDYERETVEVFSLSTHERGIILRDLDGEHPVSLALVPDEGILFVGLHSEEHSHIDMISMDGHTRTHILEDLHGPPMALVVDYFLKRLFWCNELTGEVESTDWTVNDRHLWRQLPTEPVSLAVLGQQLFWTNGYSPYLHWGKTVDGLSKNSKLKLDVDTLPVMKIAVVEQKPEIYHPCHKKNGGCSHLCIALKSRMVCSCPLGMFLKNDNKTCTSPTHCTEKEFKCLRDNICIPSKQRCNGRKDCPSGEDEEDCSKRTCPPHSFTCNDGQCIDDYRRCDSFIDCLDGSDEKGCQSKKICDENDQFTCGSGECIDRRHVCDLITDCRDGSDEVHCEDVTCNVGDFRCHSGACIPASWECDGALDCDDASDEHDGCKKTSCSSSEFKCANGYCVNKILVCDGHDDCGDGSDETCHGEGIKRAREDDVKKNTCPKGHFSCNSRIDICLPESARCNRTAECPNREDEENCGCANGMFECQSGRCIPQSWHCDGTDDCGDGSDERGCGMSFLSTVSPQPKERCKEFTCGSGECLYYSKVCDHTNDCKDGSDEGGRCDRSCDVKNNPCSQVCHNTPTGAQCSCTLGFQLSGDGRTCRDIDECQEAQSPCSQLCRNTEGSFMCSCAKGYMLRTDRRSCKAKGEPLDVVFVTGEEIRKLKTRRERLDILVARSHLHVSGLAVDSFKEHIYWSSAISSTLSRVDVRSQTQEDLRLVERPKKMTLDWATGNIYIVDQIHFPTIKVCNVDTKKCSKIFTAIGANEITSLAVDPMQGQLFWAQASIERGAAPTSEIWRSGTDGQNVTAIIKSNLMLVSGLTIDLITRKIYWSDQGRNLLESSAMDGGHRQTLPFKEVNNPIGVALFEDHIYWMAVGSGKISKCERRSPHHCEHINLHSHDTQHFALVQTSLQPTIPNPCYNSSCSHLCVLRQWEGVSCLCIDGSICKQDALVPLSPNNDPAQEGSGNPIVVSALVLIVVCGVIVSAWYYCYKRPGSKGVFDLSLHFQNASYGLPHHIEATVFNPSERLSPGEHQYANPIFRNTSPSKEVTQNVPRKINAAPSAPSNTAQADQFVTSLNEDSDGEAPMMDCNHKVHLIPIKKK